ncbi:ArnT family glycosyltransferase [Candidatus Solirubrobacter pratensis]|uniref:ArnT family glycosyltransferase n=1 Tax=Candidatus Solirubrobacter pratensis TaxID=1298857 RepID=UPI00041D15B2|nr:glycosyltransferase family 39 protein [Candidatus Solirubrobacter pratensis]
MSVAEATRPRLRARARIRWWPLALGGLFLGALILRLVGYETGLPYVYNADENSHFVPHAVGMFGHSLNPDYFVNPPAYTYLVHALYLLRWGSDPATVGGAYAADPTTAFAIARAASGTLGAAAAVLTAVAAARLFADRRAGIVAGALLAVAFLFVHYSHFALNDAPTLAPLALALVGVAGIYRTGRTREYLLAGAALGVAIATKYTAGILVVTIAAAALASPVPQPRLRNLAIGAALCCAGFLLANPYALLDHHAFIDGLQKQTDTAAGDEGGKLGLANSSGWIYYLGTFGWGFGWLPVLAALGGGVALVVRDRRLAWVLLPAPLLLFLYLGQQSRFFARWMLPIYPLLAMLAAWGLIVALRRIRFRWALAAGAVLLCLQGLVYSIHNDRVLARADTRQLARDWMVAHIPARSKVVVEPIAPDQWAADVGFFNPATSSGNRWNKFRTSRSQYDNAGNRIRGAARVVKLEDYERITRPDLVESYRKGGYCWVITGSTQFGRAYADPEEVPRAIRYYDALERAGDLVYETKPYGKATTLPFSFDYSFNYYPLSYERPGPEIRIYRLRGCDR